MTVDNDTQEQPGAIRGAVRDTWLSLKSVFVNPALRKMELALAGSMIGDWAYATAVIVWAYAVGGAQAVGSGSRGRLVVMSVIAPFGRIVGGPAPRQRVIIGADLFACGADRRRSRACGLGAPAAPIIILATLVSLIGSVFRPAQMAWMPSLADSPEELTASNGASSTIESLAFFVGPALGARSSP